MLVQDFPTILYGVTNGATIPVLEALRENNAMKLRLYVYVTQLAEHCTLLPLKRLKLWVMCLAKNKTLEVFHLHAEITECSPIVRGLLENKTLKEFGTSENTKKNIVTCPEYVDVRRRIVFCEKPF